jgi:hypothetical protein
MKHITLAITLVLLSSLANAALYECTLSYGTNHPDTLATTFTFDTDKAENIFIKLPNGYDVGCVAFRSQPELLSCIYYENAENQLSAVGEIGSSTVLAKSIINSKETNLNCSKR